MNEIHGQTNLSIYVRTAKAYVQTYARTNTGMYMAIEPVYTTSLDIYDLTEAVRKVLKAGNRTIAHPSLEEQRKWPQPLLKAAKVSNWKKLAQGCNLYSILQETRGFTLEFFKLGNKGIGFFPDTTRTRRFPPETSLGEIIKVVLDDVKTHPEVLISY